MTKTAEHIPIGPETDEEKRTLRRRLLATGAFVGLTAAAVVGQHSGFNETLPPDIETVANSLAHPGVGYISALLSVWAADHLSRKPPDAVSAAIGGTIGNFGVELAQEAVFGVANLGASEAGSRFWEAAQMIETPKDYAFALGGVATYLISERVAKRKSSV